MRIAAQGQTIDTKAVNMEGNVNPNFTTESVPQQVEEKVTAVGEEQEISIEKLQQAVNAVNDFLEINSNSSKFIYHEGLGQYYVAVVNRDTDEVIKEIPPKKLLDAFYEMQKMVGMIVDEKI
ncbi:flagellar protein FlaG [Lysinibacillus sp. NPDC097214]|uniref:flagellar protein FlaG n=1 Tax=Lysinibacillus sp. NPDC097214 TaxID=3390584 RepID=UPI003D05272B